MCSVMAEVAHNDGGVGGGGGKVVVARWELVTDGGQRCCWIAALARCEVVLSHDVGAGISSVVGGNAEMVEVAARAGREVI